MTRDHYQELIEKIYRGARSREGAVVQIMGSDLSSG
jgi:hypothetical protein